MINELVLVGRLVSDPKIKENENGEVVNITLVVPRNSKNGDGIYETDFFPIKLVDNIGKNTIDYCRKGDLIGIKGKLEMQNGKMEIVVKSVTFLTNN